MSQKQIKIVSIIVLCVAFIFSCGRFYFATKAASSLDSKEANMIFDLQNQIDAARKSVAINEIKVIEEAVAGLDTTRVTADNEIIKSFLDSCLTWDSYDSYNEKRQFLLNEYGFSESDQFMSMFYPEVIQLTEQKSTGEIVYIDRITVNKLNCAYNGHSYMVTGVSSNVYSYFITANIISVDQNGNENQSMNAIFLIGVNSGGTIVDVQAYVPAS